MAQGISPPVSGHPPWALSPAEQAGGPPPLAGGGGGPSGGYPAFGRPPPLPVSPQGGATGQGYEGRDPYIAGRQTGITKSGYRRMGAEIYWDMRRSASSIVEYIERYYPGSTDEPSYLAAWQQGNSIDVALEEAYRRGGYSGVVELLGNDTTLELTLNSLAANWHLKTTGDAAGAKSLRAACPPGSASLAPSWAQDQALG